MCKTETSIIYCLGLSERAPCGRLEVDKTQIEGQPGYDLGASLCGARRGYICQHQGNILVGHCVYQPMLFFVRGSDSYEQVHNVSFFVSVGYYMFIFESIL